MLSPEQIVYGVTAFAGLKLWLSYRSQQRSRTTVQAAPTARNEALLSSCPSLQRAFRPPLMLTSSLL